MSTATLEVTTPSDREIALIRVFNAPRKLVFDCFTKCELLQRWGLGPRAWTLTECDIDLTVGGAWRFVTTKNTGETMIMRRRPAGSGKRYEGSNAPANWFLHRQIKSFTRTRVLLFGNGAKR